MSRLLSLRQSVISSISCIPTEHLSLADSMFFGFSLIGVVGRGRRRTSPQLVYTILKAFSFLANKDYNACEETYREALKMALALKNSLYIAFLYDSLANGAYMRNEYKEAKYLFIKLIKHLFERGVHKDDLRILHIRLKLSKIHEVLNDKKNSVTGYLYCVRHLEKKIKIYPENKNVLGLYVLTLDAYGRYLLTEGKYTDIACDCYKKAYEASVKLNGEVFEMNVSLLNDLGTIYYTKGYLNDALPYFKKAEQIGQHLPEMKSFSMVHLNLCYFYLKGRIFSQAEKHLKKGEKNAIMHDYDEGKKEAEICYAEMNNVYKM